MSPKGWTGDKPCDVCGKPVPPNLRGGRPRKRCSVQCRLVMWKRRAEARRAPGEEARLVARVERLRRQLAEAEGRLEALREKAGKVVEPTP